MWFHAEMLDMALQAAGGAESGDPPSKDNQFNVAKRAVEAWFVNKVRPGGDWDYKKTDPQFDAFGNFNYGAVGSVFWDEDTLIRGAGALKAIRTRGKFGSPFEGPDYGNQHDKNETIRDGIRYYKNHCSDF
jgi:hypothetical protein